MPLMLLLLSIRLLPPLLLLPLMIFLLLLPLVPPLLLLQLVLLLLLVFVHACACACVCVLKLRGSSSNPSYDSFSGSSSIHYSCIASRSPSVPLSLAASLLQSKSKCRYLRRNRQILVRAGSRLYRYQRKRYRHQQPLHAPLSME